MTNHVELGRLVRDLIDALMGRWDQIQSLRDQEKTAELAIVRETGRKAEATAAARREAQAELRKARGKALEAIRGEMEERSDLTWDLKVYWLRRRIRRIPALRSERVEALLDELLQIPLEGGK